MNLFYKLILLLFFVANIHAIIRGRQVARIEDYNYMAAVRFYEPKSDDPTTLFACGAVVISIRKVLTLSHCVLYGVKPVAVNFGSLEIDEPFHTVDITEKNIIPHPKDKYERFYDVAVIELDENLPFGDKIGAIEMVDKGYIPKEGTWVTMLGYTITDIDNDEYLDFPLHAVESTVTNFQLCAEQYHQIKYENPFNDSIEFCVNLRNGMHNTQKGDSGGPVILTKERKLVGIISSGEQNYPELNALISGSRDFIDNPRNYAGKEDERVKQIEHRNYMVGLIYTVNGKPFLCGATIISKYKVLTAAHCVYQQESVILKFGTLDINQNSYGVNVSKEEIITHPEFNGQIPYVNNIAVIQLKKPITFNQKVGPIGMVGKDYKLGRGISITALGYAYTNLSLSYLRYVDSTSVDFVECLYYYWEIFMYHALNEDQEMCFALDDDKKNTIVTFSGGPIIVKSTNQFMGIVSYNYDGLPEVCTKISTYRDFIDNPRADQIPSASNVRISASKMDEKHIYNRKKDGISIDRPKKK